LGRLFGFSGIRNFRVYEDAASDVSIGVVRQIRKFAVLMAALMLMLLAFLGLYNDYELGAIQVRALLILPILPTFGGACAVVGLWAYVVHDMYTTYENHSPLLSVVASMDYLASRRSKKDG